MRAEIIKWRDVAPGSKVLIQGAIMLFVSEQQADETQRQITVKYKGHEMEMGVFSDYFAAVVTQEEETSRE